MSLLLVVAVPGAARYFMAAGSRSMPDGRDKLHLAIAQLPEKQRRRLVLYYFGEFTYEQIAEMEGCTKRAVKFSVDIALKNLKEIFQG